MKSIEIKEITKKDAGSLKLNYQYSTDKYYEIENHYKDKSWNISLETKPFGSEVIKSFQSTLFEPHIDNPRVYRAVGNGEDLGYMQLGYEEWSNRVRVWDLLVLPESRGKGVGRRFMDLAIESANNLGARELVLETQSCNVPAIDFYLKYGFKLIGFDLTHYSNEDQLEKEVRMEFGLVTMKAD